MRISLRIAAAAAVLICAPARAEQSPNWDIPLQDARQATPAPRQKAPRVREGKRPVDLTALTSHPLLTIAARYVGRSGPSLGLPSRLWCRDFVNFVLAKNGTPAGNRSRRAIDALRLGSRVSSPRAGDLAVMRHHVTIVAGVHGGKVIGLGGNQGRRVKLSSYDSRRVVGFVRVL